MTQDKAFKTKDGSILFDIIAMQDKTLADLVASIEQYFRDKEALLTQAYKDGKIEEA